MEVEIIVHILKISFEIKLFFYMLMLHDFQVGIYGL
jgi:hypothetical protein